MPKSPIDKVRQIALAKKLQGEMTPGDYALALPPHEYENIGRFGGKDWGEMVRMHQKNYSPGTILVEPKVSPREAGSFAIDYGTGEAPIWQNPAFPPLQAVPPLPKKK